MIHIRGPLARLIIAVVAVFGLLVALGDVLDFYDANWKVCVPLTLVYAAGIWVFALRDPKGEPLPPPAWPLPRTFRCSVCAWACSASPQP